MMRWILILFFTISLLSCTKNDPVIKNKKQISILATTAMIGDLVKQVGKEHVVVDVLIPSALDPHSYELVKGDDEKFAQADLIFYNGLNLEHGISVRRQLKKFHEKSVCVTDPLIDKGVLFEMDGVIDPHVWMDISLWMHALTPIKEMLSQLQEEHQEEFEENFQKIKQMMEIADKEALERFHAIDPKRRFLVTSHDAFCYFTKRYLSEDTDEDWRVRCIAPEGLAPEAEMSSFDLKRVLAYISQNQIKVLFTESNLPSLSVKRLIDAGKKGGLEIRLSQKALYADSMGSCESYLEMMHHNVFLIAEELQK